jgi:carboxypeptidase PM20D1
MLKRSLLVLAALVLLLVAAVAFNTLRQASRQLDVPPAPAVAIDEKAVAETLSGAVRFATIAERDNPDASAAEFLKLHEWLAQRFPRVHATLKLEKVSNYSLLYTWPGSDAQAKPIALLAHQDVVPIAPGTEPQWQAPPFSGEIRDGFVWGRGAWDDKGNLVAQLAAVEQLLAEGFKPRQTVYLAYGHDEEIGGVRGASAIVKLLQQRGVKLDFVIDEGLLITEGIMPGLSKPAALVGVAEKGYLSVVLTANAKPGHSSFPPPAGTSAIGLTSTALARLDHEQFPASISGVAREMFETIAPEMQGFGRVALSNLWLFGPVVKKQLENNPSTNAMVRTTTALTIVNAGNKDNVIPGVAQATVNFRMLPGDSVQDVMRHVQDKAGPGIEVKQLGTGAEPSRVTDTASASYQLINRTVRSLFPETIVAPGLMIAATDSHLYEPIAEHVYRFSPVRAKPEDLSRFHGTNERIATANLAELVRFYAHLVRNASLERPLP